jgi:hypothetical protein
MIGDRSLQQVFLLESRLSKPYGTGGTIPKFPTTRRSLPSFACGTMSVVISAKQGTLHQNSQNSSFSFLARIESTFLKDIERC